MERCEERANDGAGDGKNQSLLVVGVNGVVNGDDDGDGKNQSLLVLGDGDGDSGSRDMIGN